MEPDRGLPDAFDQVEHVGALLVAHGIAEDAPEQADIGPQPGSSASASASSLRLDRASVSEGMVWEDTIWEDMAGYSEIAR